MTSGSRDSERRCTCWDDEHRWTGFGTCVVHGTPPPSPLPAEGETERDTVESLRAELDRLDSWAGLMELLDRRWPADIFPPGETVPTHPTRDAGVRIVALMRWIERLQSTSAAAGEVRVEFTSLAEARRRVRALVISLKRHDGYTEAVRDVLAVLDGIIEKNKGAPSR